MAIEYKNLTYTLALAALTLRLVTPIADGFGTFNEVFEGSYAVTKTFKYPGEEQNIPENTINTLIAGAAVIALIQAIRVFLFESRIAEGNLITLLHERKFPTECVHDHHDNDEDEDEDEDDHKHVTPLREASTGEAVFFNLLKVLMTVLILFIDIASFIMQYAIGRANSIDLYETLHNKADGKEVTIGDSLNSMSTNEFALCALSYWLLCWGFEYCVAVKECEKDIKEKLGYQAKIDVVDIAHKWFFLIHWTNPLTKHTIYWNNIIFHVVRHLPGFAELLGDLLEIEKVNLDDHGGHTTFFVYFFLLFIILLGGIFSTTYFDGKLAREHRDMLTFGDPNKTKADHPTAGYWAKLCCLFPGPQFNRNLSCLEGSVTHMLLANTMFGISLDAILHSIDSFVAPLGTGEVLGWSKEATTLAQALSFVFELYLKYMCEAISAGTGMRSDKAPIKYGEHGTIETQPMLQHGNDATVFNPMYNTKPQSTQRNDGVSTDL